MKDPIKLKELIIEKVDFGDLMISYGVDLKYDHHLMDEIQIKCPFHGRDTKPSARFYAKTKTCFCWVCRKSWDTVNFVMEKENMGFIAAIRYLLNRFKIDTSSIPDEPTIEFKVPEVSSKNVDMLNVKNNILDLRQKIPFEKYRALCAVFCMLKYEASKGTDVLSGVHKLRDKITCLKV